MPNRPALLILAALAALPLAAAGCIALSQALSAGLAGAEGDGTPGGSPAAGGSGTSDSDQSGDGDGGADGWLAGQVANVYCADVIAVRDVPQASRTGVFQAAAAAGEFSGWFAGDQVAFDPASGRLSNERRSRQVLVTLLGVREGTAGFIAKTVDRSMITLGDGSLWSIAAGDREKVLDWRTADEIVIVRPLQGADSWHLLNTARCELVRASSTF